MPGVAPEIPDLSPGSAAHTHFSLMQLLWTALTNNASYLSVASSDRGFSLPFKAHSAVELLNMPRNLLCSESNILTIRTVIQHMIKVIFASNEVNRLKNTELLFYSFSDHNKCHGVCRRKQASHAIKLPYSRNQ